MIGFALALFGLMLIAVLLLLWPSSLPRQLQTNGSAQRTRTNVAMYQQRLADIADEQQQGLIDAETAAALQQELQKQLLEDAPAEVSQNGFHSGRRTPVFFLTALLLPAMALMFYWQNGEPEAWTIPLLIKQSEQAYEAGVDNSTQLEQLADQLAGFPDRDPFVLLQARILMQSQNYPAAAELFLQLQKRLPDDAGILAQSVQARYLASNRSFDDGMSADAQRALQLDPNQPTLLGLLGMQAFEQQRFTDAVNYWEQLVKILPPESAQADVIQGPLKRARELAGIKTIELPGLTISLTLADSVSVPANAILFVFAKSAVPNAPPMPLAVQRIPSPQFPLTVRLDDSLAMTPALKLSTVDEVIVTARLSTSGNVRGNSGDLEMTTTALKWRELDKPVDMQLGAASVTKSAVNPQVPVRN